MTISRKLAHQVNDKLQVIMSLIEIGEKKEAKAAIRDLAELVNRSVESKEEEHGRKSHETS